MKNHHIQRRIHYATTNNLVGTHMASLKVSQCFSHKYFMHSEFFLPKRS